MRSVNDDSSFRLASPLRDELWSAVTGYTNARIALTTKAGRFVFANEAMRRSLNPSRRDIAGCTWYDFLGCSLAKERVQCTAQAVETTRPVVLIGMIRGLCICSVFQALGSATLEGGEVLVACHRLSAIDHVSDSWADNGPETVFAEYNDLGALAILTERELEILVLIGEGLSGPEIGRHLYRSTKTIEWHRRSLGKKLGATNRIDLARIAVHSGLRHMGGMFPRLRMRLTREERDPCSRLWVLR